MTSEKSTIIVSILVLLTGCATGGLTRQDVLRQYGTINQLSTNLAEAEGRESALLSPDSHAEAHEILAAAVEQATNANKEEANRIAQKGQAVYEKMIENMAMANDEFFEVLETRERAKSEGADSLFKKDFSKADDALRTATRLIEDKKLSEARKLHPTLIAQYADLEVKALKEGTKAAAEAAIKKAKKLEADEYAPKTFDKAVAELALVSSVLETDRTNTSKANKYARHAIWLAGRATAITELAKMFDEDDYEFEDVILWHQTQLDVINKPLKQDLPFDESDAAAVSSLRGSVEALLTALDEMRKTSDAQRLEMADQQTDYSMKVSQIIESHRAQLEELKQQFEAMKNASKSELSKLQKEAAAKMAAAESAKIQAEQDIQTAKKRFSDVRALFSENEADVSRKGDNVLISAHGFSFPRNSTDIGAKNYIVLDKIVSAINIFPNSKIVVTGNTDSQGNNDRNLRLSEERADSVTQFLTTIGKIEADRVQSKGMGETTPVATNDTKEGRAKNRRIEVLIINN